MPAPLGKELLPLKPEVEDVVELVGLLLRFAVAADPAKPAAVVILLRLCTAEDDEDVVESIPELLELVDEDVCFVAFEDLRCFDDVDDDDVDKVDNAADDVGADKFVVILMLVADVDEAIALIVESISFSGDDPESEDVSWAMGL